MLDMAADGLMKIAMKMRIYRDPTHPDQRPLRPPTPFRHIATGINNTGGKFATSGKQWGQLSNC